MLPSNPGAEIATYHFHLHNGSFIADREGEELPNWQAAVERALHRAAELVKGRGAAFWQGEHARIVVTDAIGTAVFELRFSGHLPLEPHASGPRDPDLLN
ncbi:MAG: hypothetical protein ABW003_17905 [Microvirga sp.]